MSSAASDEETEELVAALSDDTEEDDDELVQEEGEEDEEEEEEEIIEDDKEEDEQDHTTSSEQSDDDDDDNDELHVAARAGIRLLEENMHFREEVLRLNEQLTHLKDEKVAVQRTLEERDTQVSALTIHLRESILENQRVLSELNKANEQLRESALQYQQKLQQQQQQQHQSPRRRPSQRLSPRRSSLLSRPLVFEQLDGGAQVETLENEEPTTALSDGSSIESPTATTGENDLSISPSKPAHSSSATGAESPTSPRRPSSSFADFPTSPRRRPSITRLRELEAKYDDEHQRCSSLRLELNFAQRRISELKPLQSQLSDTSHELETMTSRLAELEKLLAQVQAERVEEQALIQSLRQTVAVYEQLNDPRQRGASADQQHQQHHGGRMTEELQIGGSKTAETTSDEELRSNQNHQFEKLDRAADMIGGRFNLRDENERLLQQLTTLTDQVLQLQCEPQASLVFSGEDADESSGGDSTSTNNTSSTERRSFSSVAQQRQRYLEQQVAVLQSVLRRFRLEWQHAHDARVCLEDEKAALLLQLDRLQTKLHTRTRSSSVGSRAHGSPKRKQSQPQQQETNDDSRAAVTDLTLSMEPLPTETSPETNDDVAASNKHDTNDDRDSDSDDDSEDDGDDAFERRQWQRTQAICEALLLPSSSSKEEEIENELLCFALLRRLVDSWTTDKPKRMQLYDWLTNAIRGTGVRRPLHLHELSSEIAMGFQTLLVPILQSKFGIQVHVDKRLRNVIVTDLQIHAQEKQGTHKDDVPAGHVQRVYHSLLSVIDGEPSSYGGGSGDEYDEWLGNSYAVRRASRSLLGK